jgi:hypothetical protein
VSRTKLDEIVEEECPRETRYTVHDEVIRIWCKRIALRAFRHGVERTGVFANCSAIYGPLLPQVQPAPVESKLYDSGLEYKGAPWKWQDRRKGQRRKHEERTQDPVRGIPAVFWFVHAVVAGVNPDFRSGKERRALTSGNSGPTSSP